jgi:ribosome-associated translation inhibitor RaiA
MFSAVSRFGTRCSRLNVYIEEAGAERDGAQYGCAAVLDLLPAGQVRVRASAGHLYAAIDRAAECLSRDLERRLSRKARSERSRS